MEYEIVEKFLNGCAGAAYPQTSFEEADLESTDSYILAKHGKDFDKFRKEISDDGKIIYTYENGVTYIYEFTAL